MNDERLSELREKFKGRNLLEELGWGSYANHSGYQSKSNGEFINWLCNAAYRKIKEKPEPQWIPISEQEPNTGEHVLVTLDWGDGDYEVTELDYGVTKYDAEHGNEMSKLWIDHVIAWRPLPEPMEV